MTEHDHRLLCASCLAAEAAAAQEKREKPIPFRSILQLGAATFVLWMAFYVMGQTLLLIPSEFHHTLDTFDEEMGIELDETGNTEPGGDDGISESGETAG